MVAILQNVIGQGRGEGLFRMPERRGRMKEERTQRLKTSQGVQSREEDSSEFCTCSAR